MSPCRSGVSGGRTSSLRIPGSSLGHRGPAVRPLALGYPQGAVLGCLLTRVQTLAMRTRPRETSIQMAPPWPSMTTDIHSGSQLVSSLRWARVRRTHRHHGLLTPDGDAIVRERHLEVDVVARRPEPRAGRTSGGRRHRGCGTSRARRRSGRTTPGEVLRQEQADVGSLERVVVARGRRSRRTSVATALARYGSMSRRCSSSRPSRSVGRRRSRSPGSGMGRS